MATEHGVVASIGSARVGAAVAMMMTARSDRFIVV
jgi:hypothetical protein